MKTATLVKELEGFNGQASLYSMSEPLEGNLFVIVSAANVLGRPETYIFAATEEGEIASWIELDGSQKDTLDHSAALANAGYSIK